MKMKNKGFTLIEILITIFLISVILMATVKAFFYYFKINILANERAIKTSIATQRLEEWKSVKGENFIPGVMFPIYRPTVNTSTGIISFSRTLVSIPAITQLQVDCTTNTALIQNTGYGYILTNGTFSNPGYGSTTSCWVNPTPPRTVGDATPGKLVFTIDCPAGSTGVLEMQMIDYASMNRTERVVINNLVKGTYTDTQMAPALGISASYPLTAVDTSSGHLTVEVEQTGVVNNSLSVVDDMVSSSGSWTRSPSSISRSNITTPFTPLPYTETDSKAMTVYGPGSSGQSLRRTLNTTAGRVGDTLALWARLDNNMKLWFTTSAGSSNTVTSAVTGWQKLSRVTTSSSEHNSSTPVTIRFEGLTTPNTSDAFIVNQFQIEKASPPNPNAVLSGFTLKTLIGFTDPDSTAGSPVTTATFNKYIVTSSIMPTDSVAGAALGYIVTVSVSKENDLFEPIILTNTINR